MAAIEITRRDMTPAELRAAAGKAKDARAARRMLALALVLEGVARTTAAETCGMDRQTLRDWVHRYNAEGLVGLTNRRSPGRQPLLSPDQKAALAAQVEAGPDPATDGVVRWRRVDLKRWIEQRFGVAMHERTVGKQLAALGYRRLAARPQHPKADPAAQAAFKNFSEAVAAALPEAARGKPLEIWFQDEARVGQQGTLTRLWAKRGTRPRAVRDTRYEWAYIFGAVCPARAATAALVLPGANADAFALHLAEVSRTVAPGAHALLVLDGAGWHGTAGVTIPDNITLLTLPPYSPELNPIENVWQYLRQNKLAITIFDGYADMQTLAGAVHNKLTVVANTGEFEPELAESWEATPDAREWTFTLRRGVEFHNGKTLEAADVVASIDHHRGEESKSAAKPIVDPITEIRTDGRHRVVFTLESGNADFPYLMSDYHLAILPAEDGKVDATSGIGCGGYTLVSFEPGVHSTVTRFPNYWKEDRAHFDGAELLAIIDVAARTNALMTGRIDAMDRVDLKTAHLLVRNPEIEIVEASGNAHYTFAMRTDMAPFDDNDVRLALKHALDRQELLDKILFGHGYLGNDHPIGKANRFYAADLPQRAYDPEKAKFHLKKAGMESLKVSLSAADAAFPGAVDAAVLYKEHAARAGITIDVVREPNDGYWANVWMKKPWCAVYWGG